MFQNSNTTLDATPPQETTPGDNRKAKLDLAIPRGGFLRQIQYVRTTPGDNKKAKLDLSIPLGGFLRQIQYIRIPRIRTWYISYHTLWYVRKMYLVQQYQYQALFGACPVTTDCMHYGHAFM